MTEGLVETLAKSGRPEFAGGLDPLLFPLKKEQQDSEPKFIAFSILS
jgi:hypothetical protein